MYFEESLQSFGLVVNADFDNSLLNIPVITICGATGTGKSKLAIALAKLFSGEVINADAMQLYRGLDIATNKVSDEEMAGVPHHLLACLPPSDAAVYDVRAYRTVCTNKIQEVRRRRRLPFLVGGTHYYIEATLWSDFLDSRFSTSSESECYDETARSRLPSNPRDYYNRLLEVAPEEAKRLHPNNVRKLRRALLRTTSRSTQERERLATEEVSESSNLPPNRPNKPRYPASSFILWLDCNDTILRSVLDNRVDAMLDAGLVKELDAFIRMALPSTSPTTSDDETRHTSQLVDGRLNNMLAPPVRSDHRRGILQVIGFKEFTDYLSLSLETGERKSPSGQQLYTNSVERVKNATKQYAKRQVRWISNRFLRRPVQGSLPVYRIDVTEAVQSSSPDQWREKVLAPVVLLLRQELQDRHMLEQFCSDYNELNNLLQLCPTSIPISPEPLRPPEMMQMASLMKSATDSLPRVCATCDNRIFVRQEDWEAHLKSRGHARRCARVRRAEASATKPSISLAISQEQASDRD